MRVYKLSSTEPDAASHPPAETHQGWAGSRVDADTIRSEWVSSGKVRSRDYIHTELLIVPEDKQGLIAFLNKHANR